MPFFILIFKFYFFLKDSINIRDGVENSIGAILSDFKATIDEIVNIPKSNKNDSKEVRVQNSVFENDPIFFFII